MGKSVLGIDVGGSATKIVGFRESNGKRELIAPQIVHANDPLTSIYFNLLFRKIHNTAQ